MENKMKEKPKQLWLEALRSGKYNQITGKLKYKDGYCCLGVLCDIYAKSQKKKGFDKIPYGDEHYHVFQHNKEYEATHTLPKNVIKWAGLDNSVPFLSYKNGLFSLSFLNDNEKLNFNQIADLIEKSL